MDEKLSNPENLPIIYVTGFGPFRGHRINASEKVVNALATFDIENELKVKLVTEILEVSYGSVMKHVPAKWESMKPKLVIHLGVSGEQQKIELEKQAFNDGYVQPDVNNCFLLTDKCIPDFPQVIHTQLDLEKAVAEVEKDCVDHVQCSLSSDPGRYLCGFIYYLSLSFDKNRCVFIHVPILHMINKNPEEAARRMARTVYEIMKKLYQQVLEMENKATPYQESSEKENEVTQSQSNLEISNEATPRENNLKIENEALPCQSNLEIINEATHCQSQIEC